MNPPSYSPAATPPAGLRIPASTTAAFPSHELTGPAPLRDLDGSAIFVASALVGQSSVHPCKVVAKEEGVTVYISYAGAEKVHHGRYDILPFTNEMEWISTSNGRVPKGRRVVEGGFEEDGAHLFHALVEIDGVRVPGKAGHHLNGANIPWSGGEVYFEQHDILCWK